MRVIRALAILALILASGVSFAATAGFELTDKQLTKASGSQILTDEVVNLEKAEVDTLYLLGGRDRLDGDFQNDEYEAFPDPEGWISVDLTQRTDQIWHISSFNAELLDVATVPNRAMWCGEFFNPCFSEPENPGYGNNYNELLDWFGIVPNNLVATNVTIQARLNFDLEPGYDYLYLEVERSSGMDIVQDYTGNNKVADDFVPVDVNETFLVAPEDYVGTGHNQVHLRWHVASDGLWSDADCDFLSNGAAQVD
ncbi:MAG: hypothetical protein ABIF77_15810, partial [bacterium]